MDKVSRPTNPKYPKPDRSDFKPSFGYSDHLDIAWGEGTLSDGRPYRVESWYAQLTSYLDYYFSSLGIESATEKDLEELLVSEGILVFKSNEDHHVTRTKFTDASGNKMWKISVETDDETDGYVDIAVTYARANMKKFERPPSSSIWGPVGMPQTVDPESDETYIAICNEGMYQAYFINNSSKPIDVLFENWLRAVDTLGEDVRIDDIDEDFVENDIWLTKYTNIPPKSYVKLYTHYYNWDFDWSNYIHLALKTGSEEKLLHFYMRSLFIAFKPKRIPILNREGWVCDIQPQNTL